MPYFKCTNFEPNNFDLIVLLAAFGAIIIIWYVVSLASCCGNKPKKGGEEDFNNHSQWWQGNGNAGSDYLDNPHHYPDQGPSCDSPWSENALTEARALRHVGAFKIGTPYDGESRMIEQVGSTGITSSVYDIMDGDSNKYDPDSPLY
jgi:hypothetical protein